MNPSRRKLGLSFLVLVGAALQILTLSAVRPPYQAENPDPPAQTVRLIFIHHSTGENWLADGDGGLALELERNNYFVSDTNYGWGPDSIGDRTDIPDWMEWFRGPESDRYLTALYQEQDQNSEFTRLLENPGGENQLILFKSCFPNSNLEGHPNDPPATWADYSVGGAKYVYNELLKYFATRPDKLFVVITAPPVSDSSYAENARAFNNWLVYDWLVENDYPYANVAVFDFYNVLTGEEAHHRYVDGRIEHRSEPGKNTAHYTTDDDHPSTAGNRKATQEFVPLLNIFYHRWRAGGPAPPTVDEPPPEIEPEGHPSPGTSAQSSSLIDDFEGGPPAGSSSWEPAWDPTTSTRIDCRINTAESHRGNSSLKIDFDVVQDSWATCALFFEELQDWKLYDGLSFYLLTAQLDTQVELSLFAGGEEFDASYLHAFTSPAESDEDWVLIDLEWDELRRVAWEENAEEIFDSADRVRGLAIGFSVLEDTPAAGTIWIDDLQLFLIGADGSEEPDELEPVSSGEEEANGLPFCGSSIALLGVLGVFMFWGADRPRLRRSRRD